MSLFNPFVVFGASKSGTTWLQKLIDTHPACRCHFQTLIFPFRTDNTKGSSDYPIVYSDNRSPYKGIFKSDSVEQQYNWRVNFLGHQRFLTKNYTDNFARSKEEREYLASYFKPILQKVIQTLLVDDGHAKEIYGTKGYTDLEQLFYIFPDAKLITIVRDGRDVVVSKRFHTRRMGVYFHGDEKYQLHYLLNKSLFLRKAILRINRKLKILNANFFKDVDEVGSLLTREAIEKYATEWVKTVTYINDFQKLYPNQVLTIYYNELYENQERELFKVFSFLGVSCDENLLRKIFRANALPLKKSKDSFFRKGGSGDWKNYFSEKDKQVFKSKAGQTLISMGFEKDDDW